MNWGAEWKRIKYLTIRARIEVSVGFPDTALIININVKTSEKLSKFDKRDHMVYD